MLRAHSRNNDKKSGQENKMVDAIEIGYAIKDRRAELGFTQAQLAEAAGVSKRCLWSLEMGRNPGVQLDKLTAVLGALGLDLVIAATDVAEITTHPETDVATDDANPAPQVASDAPSDAAASGEGFAIDAIAILTGDRR